MAAPPLLPFAAGFDFLGFLLGMGAVGGLVDNWYDRWQNNPLPPASGFDFLGFLLDDWLTAPPSRVSSSTGR